MHRLLLLLLPNLLLSGICLGEASLWHAVDDKTGDTSFFLYYDQDSSRVFNADWVEVDSGFVIEGGKFRFEAPFKTYGIKISGQLSQDRMRGDWRIPHPQFPIVGAWSAEKLFVAENWSPLGFAESEGQLVDLVLPVAKGQPFKDYSTFLTFWRKEIEPRFFALLSHSLYANGDSGYDRALRDSRPKEVYDLFQSREESLVKQAGYLDREMPKVLADLQESYPWIKLSVPVCGVVSLGYYDFKILTVGETSLLLFGTDWMAEKLKESEARRLVAEALICSFHSSHLGAPAQVASEFFYRSVASHLIQQAKLFGVDAQLDSGASAEEMAALKEQLRRDLLLSSALFFPTYFKGSNRFQTYQLCLEFGKLMSVNRRPVELFRFTKNDMRKALKEFFVPASQEKPPTPSSESGS